MWAGWPVSCLILMDVILMCMSWESTRVRAVCPLWLWLHSANESKPKAHRYACNCGIRRRSALYLIRRRAERTLGPFRTNKGETDWLLSCIRDDSTLQLLFYSTRNMDKYTYIPIQCFPQNVTLYVVVVSRGVIEWKLLPHIQSLATDNDVGGFTPCRKHTHCSTLDFHQFKSWN